MAPTQFDGRKEKCHGYKDEPPSTGRAKSLFRVGKNSRGNWVVQDQSGLCGGMFVNRTEAVKFAMFENGNRPQAVIMVPGILELDMSAQPRDQSRSPAGLHAPLARAALVNRKVSVMSPIRITAAGERLVEPIIALAHCSKLARIIVTGANNAEAVIDLNRLVCSRHDDVELRPPDRAVRRGSPRWTATFDQSDRDDPRLGGGFPESHGRADGLARPAAACYRSTASLRAGKPRLSHRGRHGA
jgi:hypothetical protein